MGLDLGWLSHSPTFFKIPVPPTAIRFLHKPEAYYRELKVY
jgi:hypothetical protein